MISALYWRWLVFGIPVLAAALVVAALGMFISLQVGDASIATVLGVVAAILAVLLGCGMFALLLALGMAQLAAAAPDDESSDAS